MKSKELFLPILASLIAFILAAILGLAMRCAFVIDIPEWFDYRNVQHAHSHVALLGWLFAVFCLFIIHYFGLEYRRFARLYWSLQFMVLGMLLSFPVMGYASLSIIFSAGHMLISYMLVYRIWRDLSSNNTADMPRLFAKTSLFFMVLSTFGTWALGPLMAMGMKGTAAYYAAIQFYLHFQFNGWFIFALIAVALAIMKYNNITIEAQKLKRFYWLLTISTVLTYALAVTWSTPYLGIFGVNSLGVVIQLLALFVLIYIFKEKHLEIKKLLSKYTYSVFLISFLALGLKIVVQSVVVFPDIAEVSYTVRNFVIGFIHLLMLGCLSLFAFGCISNIRQRALSISGTWIFVFGVVATEILLFAQGFMLWQEWGFMPSYYLLVCAGSGFILLGVILIAWGFWKKAMS